MPSQSTFWLDRISQPSFHSIGEQPVNADGGWQEDTEDIRHLVEDLLAQMPGTQTWAVADTSEWHAIVSRWHSEFVTALMERDAERVDDYLRNLHQRPLLRGIDQSEAEYSRFKQSESHRRLFALDVKSHLVRVAEALGLLPVEMGQPYREPENIHLPVSDVVRLLERHLEIEIAPPPIGHGRYGLQVGENQVMTNRDAYALYLAVRCRDLAVREGLDLRSMHLLEIGGGMGRLGYYAYQLGFRNITLLDLPQVSFIQAYFLTRALGDEVRYGREAATPGGVRVVSGTESLIEHDDDLFDLVVNADSLPEMGWDVAEDYIRTIRRKCSRLVLSANQEARKPVTEDSTATHSVVSDIVAKVGGFDRVYRFPFWLRNGYVEECYRVVR